MAPLGQTRPSYGEIELTNPTGSVHEPAKVNTSNRDCSHGADWATTIMSGLALAKPSLHIEHGQIAKWALGLDF